MSKHEEGPIDPEKTELSEKEQKVKDNTDQMLRMKADFENTKKRLEREKQESTKFANEKLLAEILPIVDNLDRALTSLNEGHAPEKVAEGLKLAQKELQDVLEDHGVERVKSVGAPFDPRFHEAVGVVEAPNEEEGTVMDEVQRGYLLNGRLIRPSRVRIAQNKVAGG